MVLDFVGKSRLVSLLVADISVRSGKAEGKLGFKVSARAVDWFMFPAM